ncbi:phosphomannomutase/phosphoglucomutase [Candidatus Nomurabacteria bacterium]|uniref:Phosphomannomutase/phosphoglucomutase n=1 Tax=candidate division WWE3 bacterium TaxID=2053526 RepID=A0A955IWW5_UNCKA|nr:phosphomannomutase/phosphoglucomutase [candidate division WWE3 bacterium]MCB9824112.1 phosphomannomutase/phosphoglucomutase [Candidatus Nomurabacteria bacterium]MCB9826917.1 phosphomannomutase/phosphoglucomutase [Candidatus Nomurabacteria bacterium]MCB9828053.1 phosphomannomutase/phosphoglucomutase [Candidatus Nomurabacteria bacterium]
MLANDNIFRTYDIRGIVDKDLDVKGAYLIGCAVGTLLFEKLAKENVTVVVGRDSRPSSGSLQSFFIEGLVAVGADVIDIGVSLTPIVHFLTCTQDFDAGIEITASHNPLSYNGFRLDYRNAVPFSSADIQEIRDKVRARNFEFNKGTKRKEDLNQQYFSYIRDYFVFNKKHKVILNCGHSTISEYATETYGALNLDLTVINNEPEYGVDSVTPNPENKFYMNSFKEVALSYDSSFELGIALDPDCDRMGLIDEKGNSYSTDRLVQAMLPYYLEGRSGKSLVVYDPKCSSYLHERVLSLGGSPRMIKTGHTFFSDAMHSGAVLGCENSGHIYLDINYGYDDGIFNSLYFLKMLEDLDISLFELMKGVQKSYTSGEIKIPVSDEKKFSVISGIVQNVKEQEANFYRVSYVDGVRVSLSEHSWFLIRVSNTTPNLTILIELDNIDLLNEVHLMILSLLASQGVDFIPLGEVELKQG